MNRYSFTVWYACRERPFVSSHRRIDVRHTNEFDAVLVALNHSSPTPFVHGSCCYVSHWVLQSATNDWGVPI